MYAEDATTRGKEGAPQRGGPSGIKWRISPTKAEGRPAGGSQQGVAPFFGAESLIIVELAEGGILKDAEHFEKIGSKVAAFQFLAGQPKHFTFRGGSKRTSEAGGTE